MLRGRRHTNNEPQRLVLTGTKASQQQFLDTNVFLDPLSAGLFPMYDRPHLRQEVSLVENIIRHIGKPLQPSWVRDGANELNTLGDRVGTNIVQVNVGEPEDGRDVSYSGALDFLQIETPVTNAPTTSLRAFSGHFPTPCLRRSSTE